MYVQCYFYYGLQSLGYQQQLNRVTTPQQHWLYNARLNLHNSKPTDKRNQSSTDTNLSTGTRTASNVTHVCTHPTSSTTCIYMRPVYTTACIFLLSN
jgi:hypothetical protein